MDEEKANKRTKQHTRTHARTHAYMHAHAPGAADVTPIELLADPSATLAWKCWPKCRCGACWQSPTAAAASDLEAPREPAC